MSISNAKSAPYDAVIVLANLMDAQGHLNAESKARLATAVEAYRAKAAPLVVTCGWPYRADCPLAIADVMRAHALEHYQIPPSDIVADTDSRDTVGDAVFSKRNLAVPRGWARLLVTTSAYHVERTREIFTFIYGPGFQIEVVGAESTESEALSLSEQRSRDAFRLTFEGVRPGDDAAIFARLRQAHPFYNGTIYPKI